MDPKHYNEGESKVWAPAVDVSTLGLFLPPDSGWECETFGCGRCIVIRPPKAPCFFWRWMQYLLIGNRWRRTR